MWVVWIESSAYAFSGRCSTFLGLALGASQVCGGLFVSVPCLKVSLPVAKLLLHPFFNVSSLHQVWAVLQFCLQTLLPSMLLRSWAWLITWCGPNYVPPCSTPGSPWSRLTRSFSSAASDYIALLFTLSHSNCLTIPLHTTAYSICFQMIEACDLVPSLNNFVVVEINK